MTIIQTLRRRILAPAISAAAIITTLGMASPASAEGYVFTNEDIGKISIGFTEQHTIPEASSKSPFSTEELRSEFERRQNEWKSYQEQIINGDLEAGQSVNLSMAVYALEKILDNLREKIDLTSSDAALKEFAIKELSTKWLNHADGAGTLCLELLASIPDEGPFEDQDVIKLMKYSCATAANGGNTFGMLTQVSMALALPEISQKRAEAIMWVDVIRLTSDDQGAIDVVSKDLEARIPNPSSADLRNAEILFLECQDKGFFNCAADSF